MYCQKCGKQISDDSKFCNFCGHNNKPVTKTVIIQQPQNNNCNNNNGVRCPRCGNTNLEIISDVQGKGASFWKLCFCGLLGLCGTGKTTTTHYWVCRKCGNRFRV